MSFVCAYPVQLLCFLVFFGPATERPHVAIPENRGVLLQLFPAIQSKYHFLNLSEHGILQEKQNKKFATSHLCFMRGPASRLIWGTRPLLGIQVQELSFLNRVQMQNMF